MIRYAICWFLLCVINSPRRMAFPCSGPFYYELEGAEEASETRHRQPMWAFTLLHCVCIQISFTPMVCVWRGSSCKFSKPSCSSIWAYGPLCVPGSQGALLWTSRVPSQHWNFLAGRVHGGCKMILLHWYTVIVNSFSISKCVSHENSKLALWIQVFVLIHVSVN